MLLSGYRCAQLATDRSSLLSFLLEEFVRQRLVRVLTLSLTVSAQFYLVGSSIVSPRGSPKYPLKVRLSLRLRKRFTVVVCLLSYLPHSKYGICLFFGDLHRRLDLELVP